MNLPASCTVRCLAPKHLDSGPSFNIRFDRGFFHCFGCGLSGQIAADSLPTDWKIDLRSWQQSRDFRRRASSIIVPETTRALMEKAREFLQASFLGSPGEAYIRDERKLDPQLAYQMGAGFGEDRLIHGLLDEGFSLDDLAQAGFVAFSGKISSSRGLVPLLRGRGMRLFKDIRRVVKEVGATGKPVYGFPYAKLANRVTFPLVFCLPSGENVITNFYGRSILPKAKIPHLKLTTRAGIPHGGFNMGVLCQDDYGMVIISEAVICALTLIQMGWPNVIALVGTNNDRILEQVISSGKSIAFGLDNDTGGWDATSEWLRRLPRLGYEGEITNFTSQFFATRETSRRQYDDFNKWWTEVGYHQQAGR